MAQGVLGQAWLFARALLQQFSLPLGFDKDFCSLPIVAFAFATLAILIGKWKDLHGRPCLADLVWLSFLTTGFGLLTIINPGVDKQNQEINIKFFRARAWIFCDDDWAIKHLPRTSYYSPPKHFSVRRGPNNVGSSRAHLTQQIDGSLKRLQTDYIDVYHMHAFDALTRSKKR